MPTIPSVSESEATATPTHTASATPTAEPTAAPGVARSEYETLTAWEFQQLFNDPAAHKGERFVVYGQADELDQAGGGFLARIGPERQTSGSNYDSEVMLSADSDASFSEVSEDDLLTMWVQVAGGSRVATNPPPSDDEEDEEDGDKSPPPPPLPLLSVDLVEVDGS
jgi:hypothetical protein